MVVEVYHSALCRRHYASRCSLAYAFFLLAAACLLILPFFLAYTSTPSFWLKTATYREQPKVSYEYKFLGLLQGFDATGSPLSIVFSSMASLNHLFQAKLRVPAVATLDLDQNRDGLTDRFQLQALMPLRPGERILAAAFVAFFDVRLRERARLQMECLAHASADSSLAGSSLFVDADYVLRQRWPLRAKGGYQLPYDRTPLLDTDDLSLAPRQALLPRLLAAYAARNTTMDLDRVYTVWSPAVEDAAESFNLSLTLKVPTRDVLYTPTASEVLRDAWLKYLATFVVVAILLDYLCAFVYHNHLLDTDVAVDAT